MAIDGDQALEQSATTALVPDETMIRIVDVSPASGTTGTLLDMDQLLSLAYDESAHAIRVVVIP